MNNFIGKKVIIRGDRSGVFFGTLAAKDGQEVKLEKCRRLWYWDGAASISQLAVDGTSNPSICKFTVTVDEIGILDAIEIIPCTDKARRRPPDGPGRTPFEGSFYFSFTPQAHSEVRQRHGKRELRGKRRLCVVIGERPPNPVQG